MFTGKKNLTILAVIALLLMTFLIRVPFVKQNGLDFDRGYWVRWTNFIQDDGAINVYDKPQQPDYPPGYLYMLQAETSAFKAISGHKVEQSDWWFNFICRFPAFIGDAAIGLFLFFFLKNKYSFKAGFNVAVLYVLSLPILYDSAIWGQVDSMHTFFMMLSLYFAYRKKFVWMWVLYAVALIIKFQSIMIFIPLIVYTFVYGGKWKGIVKYSAVALITGLLVSAPFLLTGKIFQVVTVYINYIGGDTISANCLNLWWPVNLLLDGLKESNHSLLLTIASLLKPFGLIMFIIGSFLSYKLIKKDSKYLFLASAFSILTFVMFNLSMHDRYLYPFIGICLMFILATTRKFKFIFLFYFITYTYNLFLTLHYGTVEWLFTPWVSVPIAILNVIVYFVLLKLILNELSSHHSDIQRKGKYIYLN